MEIARNVLGVEDAEHAETSPGAERLVVTPLACSLAGESHPVRLLPGTRLATLYGGREAVEPFFCNYGVDEAYRDRLEAAGLRVAAVGDDDEIRALELDGHPFFVLTLFVPRADGPHPLFAGLAQAVA